MSAPVVFITGALTGIEYDIENGSMAFLNLVKGGSLGKMLVKLARRGRQ